MAHSSLAVSLMLMASFPSVCLATIKQFNHDHFHRRYIDGTARDAIGTSTTTTIHSFYSGNNYAPVTTVPHLPCSEANGTQFAGNNSMWTMLCDTDFFSQNIYPFILAKTFKECMEHCEDYNYLHGEGKCAGYVFAPDRIGLENSCYLKSSVNGVIFPATIHLIAGVLRTKTITSTMVSLLPTATFIPETSAAKTEFAIVTPPRIGSQQSDSGKDFDRSQRPTVTNSTYLGTSIDEVASQYVSHAPVKPQQLAANMMETSINIDLITDFPLAPDTGSWTNIDLNMHTIAKMKIIPRISRDGGRGGNVNGINVFIFCDTSTYGEDKDSTLGYLNGFVSSSIAVDLDMNALNGEALSLVNPLGQWQDDVGRMRGWVPMTTGEEAFNIAISGKGYRYAVWPNASPIPLNRTHSVMHAPLVYLEVDMQDQSSPRYTSLGNTLLLVTIDSVYGPHAERLHNQFFNKDEVSWGSLGGIRAWSSDGQDSLNGDIYVFGQAENGVLIGKVSAQDFDDRSKYEYWDGHSWSDNMPPRDSISDAFVISQSVMSMDVIYSPIHRTFIMIYLTPQADNTFYYRYLVNSDNTTLEIVPPYEAGGDENYVEQIVSKTWSEERILFRVPVPYRGYAYAGGLHASYFGEDDITNGGTKMLCTWTEHTSIDPDKPESGYAHKSQIVEFGFES